MKKLKQVCVAPLGQFFRRRSLALMALFAIVYALAPITKLRGGDGGRPQEPGVAATATTPLKPKFDSVGPQVGDQLPDLKLRTLKGEPQWLGDAWRGGPALLVTSSFTCPKSRSRWPEVKALVEKYGDKLNVVIVYVIEAHPVGSVCPYKGVEEVTAENLRDNILRHQPTTVADRLELAQEFKRYLRVDTPIYVDTLANDAWKAFGAAPNIAFLVDNNGIVAARQGWFEGEAMEKSIDKLLIASHGSAARTRVGRSDLKQEALKSALTDAGFNARSLQWSTSNGSTEDLVKVLKKVPAAANLIFEISQGHRKETSWLMQSIDDRNLAAAELLLAHGADIKAQTYSFDSALQLAAGVGQGEMVKLLLRHHAEVNVPATGRTPLHEATLASHLDIARILIAAGAKEDFYSDVAMGKAEAVRKALTADPSRALRPDGAGRMPLDYAAANGQLEIAGLLLASGAPVVEDDLSRTLVPLHYAIHRENPTMVELLLKAGSSPNTALGYRGESPESEPPLHMAITAGNAEIVKVLLTHKADLGRRDTYSRTPLHYAAELGKVEFVKLLLGAGADVNARQLRFDLPCGSGEEETPSQNTPLHFAAAQGNPATIEALLDAGAKIDAVNVHGITPLMSTVKPPLYTGINEESQLKNAEALLAAGANLNARDNRGRTVLDLAMAESKSKRANAGPKGGRHPSIQELIDVLAKHGAKPGEPKAEE